MSLEVSVTQCNICGTLSTHWGVVDPHACTRCSDTATVINNYLDSLDSIDLSAPFDMGPLNDLENIDGLKGLDISSNNAAEPWNSEPLLDPMSQQEFLSLPEIQADMDEVSFNSDLLKVVSWEELNTRIPLLTSIRNSFMVDWASLQTILLETNELLDAPEEGWKYMSVLELKRDRVESLVVSLNSFISESHTLGCDITSASEALFCCIADIPPFDFDGKEILSSQTTLMFYFEGESTFSTFSAIDQSASSRRWFSPRV